MPKANLLAKTLVELADTLVDHFDVVELLTLLSDRCLEVLDVSAAGIMLATPEGELRTMASTSEAMHVVELFEIQTHEGPCLDCYRTGEPVRHPDLSAPDGPWPRFAAKALGGGFHAVQAVPMRLRGTVLGALNLFHVETGQMTQADLTAAQAFADVATIAILQHQAVVDAQDVNQQLTGALNSRVVIEQAKGMVAERRDLDMDQAYAALRRYALAHDLRLLDVAEDVVHGTLASHALDRRVEESRK